MTKLKQTLWDAARTGLYPPGTTAQDLANDKDNFDYTALHTATWSGYYPPGTTAQDLAKVKDNEGCSALHEAAWHGSLPPDTTNNLLKTTKDNKGNSAWQQLCNYLQINPTYILDLPHYLFQHDNKIAITTIETAIKNDPNLQSKAAIWLGHVLAGNQTPHPTPPTH